MECSRIKALARDFSVSFFFFVRKSRGEEFLSSSITFSLLVFVCELVWPERSKVIPTAMSLCFEPGSAMPFLLFFSLPPSFSPFPFSPEVQMATFAG